MIPNEDKTARQCFYGFLTAIKRYFVQIQLANATSLYIYVCIFSIVWKSGSTPAWMSIRCTMDGQIKPLTPKRHSREYLREASGSSLKGGRTVNQISKKNKLTTLDVLPSGGNTFKSIRRFELWPFTANTCKWIWTVPTHAIHCHHVSARFSITFPFGYTT